MKPKGIGRVKRGEMEDEDRVDKYGGGKGNARDLMLYVEHACGSHLFLALVKSSAIFDSHD
jgi:hypothetical protein